MRPQDLLLLSCLVIAAGKAQGAGVEDCQALAEPMPRLACYDKYYPPRVLSKSKEDSVAAGKRQPVETVRPAKESFGLPNSSQGKEEDILRSEVADDFYGWDPNQKIELKNGQVWQVIDGSTGVLAGNSRRILIQRSVFGSYIMEFEGLTKTLKVKRIK